MSAVVAPVDQQVTYIWSLQHNWFDAIALERGVVANKAWNLVMGNRRIQAKSISSSAALRIHVTLGIIGTGNNVLQ